MTEGRIADEKESPFVPWEPGESLPMVGANEVRYSRGFLVADVAGCVTGLQEHWVPLFLNLGVELRLLQIRKHLSYPQDLSRITVIEANGESALIGIDETTQAAIVGVCAPQLTESAADLVLEYLERRLASTLTKSWAGKDPITFRYPSAGWADEVEVIGALEVSGAIGGRPMTVWFGLGPRLTDEVDAMWRSHIARESAGRIAHDDQVHEVAVEIAQLAVPPARLIDYMRAGTVIDLEVPCDAEANLRIDGRAWVKGALRQLNGLFAVEVTGIDAPLGDPPESTTRVTIEIARTEIESGSRAEYEQSNAILPTSRTAKGVASLLINGEIVATALVGRMGDHLALRILPR